MPAVLCSYGASVEYFNRSLVRSLEYFLSVVAQMGKFGLEEYRVALRSNRIVLHEVA